MLVNQAPFGMGMPGRQYNAGDYRFGYNGSENDNEVKGNGNSLDFGARIYDSRLCRFLSVEPLSFIFPWQSTYAYALNSPVAFVDEKGLSPNNVTGASSNTEIALQESSNSSETTIHSFVAIAQVAQPNNMESNFTRKSGNWDKIFVIVPGQTSFYYGDAGVYDRIQLVIDNPTPPPPTIVLWDTDNNRSKKANTNYFQSTNEEFNDPKKDFHPFGRIQSPGTNLGWGNYQIPKSYGGKDITKVRVVVTTWTDPQSTLHNQSVLSGASLKAKENSVWAIDLIMPKPAKRNRPLKYT